MGTGEGVKKYCNKKYVIKIIIYWDAETQRSIISTKQNE